MEKEKVIKLVDQAIKSLEDGSWTMPSIVIAFLTALKYFLKA